MERMSATTTTPTAAASATSRRDRVIGLFLLGLAAVTLVFLPGAGGRDATFVLNDLTQPTAVQLPNLVLPVVPTVIVMAVIAAALGGVHLTRGFGARTTLVIGVALGAFVFAFLTWATRDQTPEPAVDLPADHPRRRAADLRGAVRRALRTLRRDEHRHRGPVPRGRLRRGAGQQPVRQLGRAWWPGRWAARSSP